jgi:uncharacterized protein YkwD
MGTLPLVLMLALQTGAVHPPPRPEATGAPCASDAEASEFFAALAAARGAAGRPAFTLSPVLCAVAQRRATAIGRRSPPITIIGDLPAVGADLERVAYRAFAWDLGSFRAPETGASLLDAWRRRQPEFMAHLVASEASEAGYGRAANSLAGDPAAIHVLVVTVPLRNVTRRRMENYWDLAAVRREILAASNAERAARGLAPFAIDPRLERAAQAHAERMLAERFYDHTDPRHRGPRDRARDEGFAAPSIAENLARGLYSPREVISHWMDSSGHRANLLAPQLTRIGIGCAFDASGDTEDVLWVQLLASEPQ